MAKHFTHLHLHTEYSLLDGAIHLEELIKFGKENNFKSLAITDHGNVFGAVKFFQLAKKAGIKPILGIEMYFTDDIAIKAADKKYHHLILIVQNAQGYKNLCKLLSYAYQQGFYFKPRIDYKILEKHAEGLIATTACLGGHIPQLLMVGDDEAAQQRTAWFKSVFGKERFYFEIQPANEQQDEQKVLNKKLIEWAAKEDIPLLATADCHYVHKEDKEAHEVMLCIQTQAKLTDPDRFTFGQCQAYMRTTDEMLTEFAAVETAVWNSGKIADSCDFDFQTGKLFFPQFTIPQEYTAETFFAHLCNQGFEELLEQKRIDSMQEQIYRTRLEQEITLITKMGFVGYFLVVSDFIQWAKKQAIPVGPGRGSVAGSLVAWALKITNIDPLKYNLLFERFLNPERVSMPDIDIDFCINGRDQVINYVRQYYGHNKVGQIITFGTMMAKGVVKDVARVLGVPFEDANMLTDLISDQLKITLKEAIEQEPRLKEMIEQNPKVNKLFELAFKLEGLTRHASKHAAGVVISPEPIDEVLPVYIPPKSTELVTQYAMTELESLGFLKIDFLGLKNLTLIDNVLRLIAHNHGLTLNMDLLALDDKKTFALLGQGKTSGVFQLESDGIKEVLIKLQPEKFEDIIAVNALYRPGPLGSGMVDDFIERRHGRQKITYIFEQLEPILQETYGVIVYQEQVMKIASAIANYSLGEADILRRAMGKKKPEEMAKQRAIFLERAKAGNFDTTKSGELFDLMAYFAGYGFNKSHSAAYALIAYQTAYLKAHYPAEFMACLISLEADHPDKMSFYLQEAKDMGLAILPPNINASDMDFTVIDGKLLFGLRGIKNVGTAALESIIAERKAENYRDLLDFCTRVDLRTVNKRVIESLICAGACDVFGTSRAQQFDELELIIERATADKKAKETGQLGLFELSNASISNGIDQNPMYQFTSTAQWDNKQTLEKEREVIGFYLSAHPLDTHKVLIQWLAIKSFEDIRKESSKTNSLVDPFVLCCGLLTNTKQILTKKNDRMAFLTLEDHSGKAEVIVFPQLFKKIEHYLSSYHVFLIKGNVDTTATQICKIKAQDLLPVELIFTQLITAYLDLSNSIDKEKLLVLKSNLTPGPHALEFLFTEQHKKLKLKLKESVTLDQSILQEIVRMNVKVRLQWR
jgi:DNA polymerase-3 subunit alpha